MIELIVGLAVVGALLIFVEFFVPGLVAGTCGALAFVAAVGLTYAYYGMAAGNWMLVAVLIGALVLFVGWMRAFPKTRFSKQWTLHAEAPPPMTAGKFGHLQGCTGKALTALRPAGTALLAGERVDVVAESGLIDEGTPVRVVLVEGARVVVRSES